MKTERTHPAAFSAREAISLEKRLLQEEKQFAETVLRRTELLGEITARRRRGRKPGADPELEKTLWKTWESALSSGSFGPHRHWRAFLAQTNSLAYALADQEGAPERKAWILRPAAASPIHLHGPSDVRLSLIFTFWAAAGNMQSTLRRPALNDGLIELIKAMNQLGAGLSWDSEAVVHRQRRAGGLELEQKTIHLGQHRTTLALMLALAMGRPGVVKFSGSGELNMLSLKPWENICTQLGARLHQLNPHAPGLPARLESGGQAHSVRLSPDLPWELPWALLAAAPFYPQGLRLTWPENFVAGQNLNTLIQALESSAVPVTRLDNGLHVHPSPPVIPEQPEIPLDPALCALLLAWSRFSSHSITVLGYWPKDAPDAHRYIDILRAGGLEISMDQRSVTATPGKWPADVVLDVRDLDEALPLAVILALGAPGKSSLVSPQDLRDLEVMTGLLRFTGRTCEIDGPRHRFMFDNHASPDPSPDLEAPSALWGMALAMLSFAYPGLTLNNPGELTTHWPRFWHVFQTVLSKSKPKPEPSSPETADAQPKKQSRRIRL